MFLSKEKTQPIVTYYNDVNNTIIVTHRDTLQFLFSYPWSEEHTPCTLSFVERYDYTMKNYKEKVFKAIQRYESQVS